MVVISVAFNNGKDDSNRGTKIVSGSGDNTIKVWEMVKFVK
jgi:WD40 repeat protein